MLLIETLGTNFSEILILIHKVPFKKMHLKMSSGKWRPFCLGHNVLNISDTHMLPWDYRIHTDCMHCQTELHYGDVIMGTIASQITSLTVVYSTVYSGDKRKHESSASMAFVRGIHRGPVNSPHKWPVTRKMFPFDDVIMTYRLTFNCGLYNTGKWILGLTSKNGLMSMLFSLIILI